MRIIDPGHVYDLHWLDGEPLEGYLTPDDWRSSEQHSQSRLTFVKREGEGYPGNVGHHPGTNCQDVLRALINRVEYLHRQLPDWRNVHILANLRQSLLLFEDRAAERHGRTRPRYSIADTIEALPFCSECGYIGCHASHHVPLGEWFDKENG